MTADSRSDKAAEIRRLLEAEGDAVAENTKQFNAGRYETTSQLDDYETLKEQAREIKETTIEQLPELLEQVEATVEENGGTVYRARDTADANEYIRSVVTAEEADTVVKSKSMTSEEIDVNECLDEAGVDVWETDLGEFVLQIADEAPSHIVAPAIHKSRDDIARLFNEYFDPVDPLETAEDLTRFARDQLATKIADAEVGMTGANFITADTGTIALVTSEGNARKSIAETETQIAVAGVEKLVPQFEDLQPFIELIGRSGTGQDITSYISLLTPPVRTPIVDATHETPLSEQSVDRDFHLVLIDNGRMAMREDDQLRETLYCIRCSACANSCANFQHVGGHAFGGETYSGGIATGWEAGVEGLDTAAEFNDLCTGCSRCVNQCPVKIDIPWINTVVRDRINRGQNSEFDWLVEGLAPDDEPGGMNIQKRFFGNFETIAKLGSRTAPLSNWLGNRGPVRHLLERVVGIDKRRPLPQFERESLVAWFQQRRTPFIPNPASQVVLYPDLYTNYVQVERGKAAVRALEALGVDVVVPDVASSGRAPLSQGMISTAKTHAHRVFDTLAAYLADGMDVVVIEPSSLAMFRQEYEKFLSADEFKQLADNTYEVMEYIYGLAENDVDLESLQQGDGTQVAYHSHCQQRTLKLEGYTETLLDRLGYDVLTSDVECCGMAGSFGYKQEYYSLSVDVGEDLAAQFESADAENRTVVASGTSCLEQLDNLLQRPAVHPIQLLAPDMAASEPNYPTDVTVFGPT